MSSATLAAPLFVVDPQQLGRAVSVMGRALAALGNGAVFAAFVWLVLAAPGVLMDGPSTVPIHTVAR